MINLSVPNLKGNEALYIQECIDTEWVSSVGKYVEVFEERITKYTGSKFAVACASGTSALHLSLIVSGVCPNDEVLVPTMTFIATPNSVSYLNAVPVFMDCDEFYNIDVKKVISFIKGHTYTKLGFTYNKNTNRRIMAIIPVHVSGNAVDLDSLVDICNERNIKIIEDAAEALGTSYTKGKLKGKHVGTVGLLGCLSFNGNKIITSGGGGMIITNDSSLAERAKYLSTQANDDSQHYIHNEIGYNYRLTNIQAALGVAQLEKLPNFIKKKKYIHGFYKKNIKSLTELKVSQVPPYASNNHWMTSIQVNLKNATENKEKLLHYLSSCNIQSRPMWHLCHKQLPYKKNESFLIENAYNLHNQTLNIPCSTGIKDEELVEVVKKLNDFF